MSKLQIFPQITRVFSAALLWLALLFLYAINIVNAPNVSVNVLGAFQAEKDRILHEYAFWQTIAKEKPDYRDAYIALSARAYQLSRFTEGKEYLAEARILDPNNPVISSLLGLFPLEAE